MRSDTSSHCFILYTLHFTPHTHTHHTLHIHVWRRTAWPQTFIVFRWIRTWVRIVPFEILPRCYGSRCALDPLLLSSNAGLECDNYVTKMMFHDLCRSYASLAYHFSFATEEDRNAPGKESISSPMPLHKPTALVSDNECKAPTP